MNLQNASEIFPRSWASPDKSGEGLRKKGEKLNSGKRVVNLSEENICSQKMGLESLLGNSVNDDRRKVKFDQLS